MVESRKLSFGVELELANVDRKKDIPAELGSWECGDAKNELGVYLGREKCIINSDLTVVDPAGIRCDRGGEVHTVPSWSIDTLVNRIKKLFELFPEADMFLPGKMHIHVGIPDWTFEEFKNIILYTADNDITLMDAMCPDSFMDEMMTDETVPEDLKYHYLESRRTINNPDIAKKILDYDTKKEVCYWWGSGVLYYFPKPQIFYHGKFQKTPPRVRSQSLHIQHLISHNTIEFRNFAPTMNLEEIKQCLLVAEKFTREALKGKEGQPMKEWIGEYHLPKWKYESKYICEWWKVKKEMSSNHSEISKGFHEFKVD